AVFLGNSTGAVQYRSGRHHRQHVTFARCDALCRSPGGAYVPALTMAPKLREDRPGRASDHVSFINNGYPAVRLMETFECSPSPVDNSCGGPLPCPPPAKIPAFCKDTSFITTHQHSPHDQVQFITPTYAASIAQVIGAV